VKKNKMGQFKDMPATDKMKLKTTLPWAEIKKLIISLQLWVQDPQVIVLCVILITSTLPQILSFLLCPTLRKN